MIKHQAKATRKPLLFKRPHSCTTRYRHGGTASIYPLWYAVYQLGSLDEASATLTGASHMIDIEDRCVVLPFHNTPHTKRKLKDNGNEPPRNIKQP